MKTLMTRDRYTTKFAKFLDSINSDEQRNGAKAILLEDSARAFARKATADFNWAFSHVLRFVRHLKERADRKEITVATVRN